MHRHLVARGGATLLAIAALNCASRAALPPHTAEPLQAAQTPAATSPLKDAALVLDVRNADEYAQGHLEKATLIPVTELEQRLGEVDAAVGGDKSKKIVVYCGTGRRAGKARELLLQHGYSNVVNGGGYEDLR